MTKKICICEITSPLLVMPYKVHEAKQKFLQWHHDYPNVRYMFIDNERSVVFEEDSDFIIFALTFSGTYTVQPD
jgi:hypothetical protein